MSIEIKIIGPNELGCPCVVMGSDDGYNPDMAEDLKNRAVDAYTATFGDLELVTVERDDEDDEAGQ